MKNLTHENTFLALRDEIDLEVLKLSIDWELIAEYLKAIVDSRIFNSESSALQLVANFEKMQER